MKNSIESIWKEGFLNEKSLVAPKINDLYNQKSKHLVDKVERMFRINLVVIVIIAIIFPIIYSFLDYTWQGIVVSILLLLTAWYNKREMNGIKTLDHGTNSLDYLKSFHRWIKDVLAKSEKIARFSYPLYFWIALRTIWSAWNKLDMILKLQQKFPDSIFIENISLFALIIAAVSTLLMFWVSGKLYKWEVRLMYGRAFDKLEETIAEMEKLKQE